MVVVITASSASFALLQNAVHEAWVRRYCSTMGGGLRYTTSDGLSKFPLPKLETDSEFGQLADAYIVRQQASLRSRNAGLTTVYNAFHNSRCEDHDIKVLRELQVQVDNKVTDAYGWGDLDLGHGFHETKQGVRFTISEEARREVLDRLLLLNHQRYAEEVAQGLHDKKANKGKTRKRTKPKANDGTSLFPELGDET